MTDLNSADLLHGVDAISRFLGLERRQAQHWIDTSAIPTFKIGRSVCARRSTLTRWLQSKELAAQAGKSSEGDADE